MDAVIVDVEAHIHLKKEKVETKMSYAEPNDVERVSRKSMFVTIDLRKRKHHVEVRCP